MGKINKNRILSVFFMFLLSLSLVLTGCGSSKTEQKQETVQNEETQEQTEEKKETTTEEIPSDLLPGQETEEMSSDEDSLEIVEESGKVYTTKKSSAGGQSEKNSEKNNGGSQKQEQETGIIQISFGVESSKADGSVSFSADITLDEGSTVYDALAASGIAFSGQSYISEIGGLGEKMFGSQSGWKYYVNGAAPGKSCNKYVLKNGDKVQWKYVLSI